MWQKLWERAKNTIDNKKGDVNIFALLLVCVLVCVLIIGFEYSRRQIVFRTVQDNVTEALTSCAAGNLYESYGTVREGTSGAYVSDGTTYKEIIDTQSFISQMSMFYAANPDGASVGRLDSQGRIYMQIKDIQIYVSNSKSLADKESTYLVRYNFSISRQFFSYKLYTYPIEQKVKYTNKF